MYSMEFLMARTADRERDIEAALQHRRWFATDEDHPRFQSGPAPRPAAVAAPAPIACHASPGSSAL
jgi:hypothetical protein